MLVRPNVEEVTIALHDVALHARIVLTRELHAPSGLIVLVTEYADLQSARDDLALSNALHDHGYTTVMVSLLTDEERRDDSSHLGIQLLAARLVGVLQWLRKQPFLDASSLGIIAHHTGAAATLVAASQVPDWIKALVLIDGRPDLVMSVLPKIMAPVLLITGDGSDDLVSINETAFERLRSLKHFLVLDANDETEAGLALETTVERGTDWLQHYVSSGAHAMG